MSNTDRGASQGGSWEGRRIRIAFISTSRSDYSTIEPVLRGALRDQRFDARLAICGQHLKANTPLTEELEGIGATRLADSADSLDGISQQALLNFLSDESPDLAFLVGDRFELLSAAECCTLAGVPIGHCSGGERTFGAFDDQVRDAVTKLSHLHFVSHSMAAERVASLQEEQWRIAITGDPGLDPITHEQRATMAELEAATGLRPSKTDVVVTIHPVTRNTEETAIWTRTIAEFSSEFKGKIFLSSPNGDPGSEQVWAAWALIEADGRRIRLPSLGARMFRSLSAACGAFVGNSSAGIWEVPSLGVPSLDLGTRQSGRFRGDTVWHCQPDQAREVESIVRRLLTDDVQQACRAAKNPYGDGHATPRILDHIARWVGHDGSMVKA